MSEWEGLKFPHISVRSEKRLLLMLSYEDTHTVVPFQGFCTEYITFWVSRDGVSGMCMSPGGVFLNEFIACLGWCMSHICESRKVQRGSLGSGTRCHWKCEDTFLKYTSVFLFCIKFHFATCKEEAYHSHAARELCKKGVSGRMGEALGSGTLCMEVHLGGNTILL